MDGGSLEGLTTNSDGKAVQNRKYQVSITFQNPQGTNLKDGKNDDGSSGDNGTENSGKADFAGWYSDNEVSVSIIGENGEVTTNTDVFAKWLQYRYSGANNDESKWTIWGTSNE